MITLENYITFDNDITKRYAVKHHNLVSLEITRKERKDLALPCWGIISNGGNIEFIDYDGTIKSRILSGIIHKETIVETFLLENSTITKSIVSKMYAKEWQYDEQTKKVYVTLSDNLEKLQDINIDLVKTPMVDDMLASTLYNTLRDATIQNGFNVMEFANLDATTKSHLENYAFPNFFIDNMTLWGAWKNFCEALQLYMYQDKNGEVVCVYKGGK